MHSDLPIGTKGTLHRAVSPHEMIHLGSDHPDGGAVVYATPHMINLMEHAAREALRPFLEPNEESVGVTVEIKHTAPTPLGGNVHATATVTGVDGKTIDFDVEAFDEDGSIGKGTHRRAVIRVDRFARALTEKAEALPIGGAAPGHVTPNTGALPNLNTLAVEQRGHGLAIVRLNRPQALNAVNDAMTGDWEQLNAWLAGHAEQVRVVIVTGEGKHFCAGDDVKEVETLSPEQAHALSLRQARMYLAWERLPQVFIAAVNGFALGGGCVAAYSCDLRVAETASVFGMPEIKLGWTPGYGIAQLTALVGKARCMELVLTGKQINANTALGWGLVNHVVPGNRLLPEAQAMAEQMLAMPPIGLSLTKKAVHADEGLTPKITYAADTHAYIECFKTRDAQEGMAAFREKRPAKFEGR